MRIQSSHQRHLENYFTYILIVIYFNLFYHYQNIYFNIFYTIIMNMRRNYRHISVAPNFGYLIFFLQPYFFICLNFFDTFQNLHLISSNYSFKKPIFSCPSATLFEYFIYFIYDCIVYHLFEFVLSLSEFVTQNFLNNSKNYC